MSAAQKAAAAAAERRLRPTVDMTPAGIRARIRYGADNPETTWPRSIATFNPVAARLVDATRKAIR